MGLTRNENPNQGGYFLDELTDLVEAAVLDEFDWLAERGRVLGAMETGYQRGRIQDESMLYEHRKHDGTLPIVGVNTPQPRRGARPAGRRARPFHRRREAVAAAPDASSRPPPRRRPGRPRPAAAGGAGGENTSPC